MNKQKYENALYYALVKQLAKYEKKLSENPERERKHVGMKELGKYITPAAAIGAILGTAVPGIGNAVGAAVGAVAGVAIAGGVELHYRRQNKKFNNARSVLGYLGKNARNILREVAIKTVEERLDAINSLRDTDKNKKRVAEYLAVNLMSAIKHDAGYAEGTRAEVAVNGLQHPRSKKKLSRKLKTTDGSTVTLKNLAALQFFKPKVESKTIALPTPFTNKKFNL